MAMRTRRRPLFGTAIVARSCDVVARDVRRPRGRVRRVRGRSAPAPHVAGGSHRPAPASGGERKRHAYAPPRPGAPSDKKKQRDGTTRRRASLLRAPRTPVAWTARGGVVPGAVIASLLAALSANGAHFPDANGIPLGRAAVGVRRADLRRARITGRLQLGAGRADRVRAGVGREAGGGGRRRRREAATSSSVRRSSRPRRRRCCPHAVEQQYESAAQILRRATDSHVETSLVPVVQMPCAQVGGREEAAEGEAAGGGGGGGGPPSGGGGGGGGGRRAGFRRR